MNLTEIGQALRAARKQRGLTLQKVADDLGMSIATISRLERGDLDDIGVRRLLRVAEYVGMQVLVRSAGFGMTLDEAMKEADRDFQSEGRGPRP
ncbi:helix-turn-helix transcriptional regulator [Variovorax sp. LjRoot290]|uniref:helix-turn-helix domain-containing protein n=1 Tax=unclassified Variovorax TaxID=663243 RepID=UPI003ECCAEF8